MGDIGTDTAGSCLTATSADVEVIALIAMVMAAATATAAFVVGSVSLPSSI